MSQTAITEFHLRSNGFDTSRKLSLREIRSPVSEELAEFQHYFKRSMGSKVRLVSQIARYVLGQKGKQVRPLLVFLSAKLSGGVTDATYHGAALVELLHTATLIHDDVVDKAERRRGVFSVNALWKNKVAVLFGDFLLSRGLLLALDHREYDLLHVVSDSVRRMSEGELLQIEKSRHLDIDEETYFRIISDKTASLISACTACGAISATDDDASIQKMREFGEKVGLAFQIRDDLFDFGVDDVGKPLGLDLQEKKMTLPLIHALREADAREKRRIMRIVRQRKKSRKDIRTVSDFVERNGGIAYARNTMLTLAAEAQQLVRSFPPTPARDAMADLVQFVVIRSR